MTEQEFERLDLDVARTLAVRAAAVIKAKLDEPDAVTMADAIKVYDSTAKRLGLNVNEKRENLPVIHWTINGGSVTIAMDHPKPQADTTDEATDVEDVIPKPPNAKTPEEAFSLSFDGVESMRDDL